MIPIDKILNQYILQDLRQRDYDDYTIEDELLMLPKRIEVRNDEIVYLYHFQTRQSGNFYTRFQSGMESFQFFVDNTSVHIHPDNGGARYYESGLVKRFQSNVKITHTGPTPVFQLRIVRLKLFRNAKG